MKDIKLGVGRIPLKNICYWLDQRCYSKDLAIEYIKNIYSIDVTAEIEDYSLIFEHSKNTFDHFEDKYPSKKEDDGTREWFNHYGRNRYVKFYNCFVENDGVIYDEILNFSLQSSVIHHIYPIVYGGKSNPQNLIGISDRLHNLLHMNPLENIEKYCFQALDYLKYLIVWKHDYIIDKYNIRIYEDNESFMMKVYHNAIEEEMNIFYNLILEDAKDLLK